MVKLETFANDLRTFFLYIKYNLDASLLYQYVRDEK